MINMVLQNPENCSKQLSEQLETLSRILGKGVSLQQAAINSQTAHYHLGGGEILMVAGLSHLIGQLVARVHDGGRIFIVTDENVYRHHGAGMIHRLLRHMRVKCHVVGAGESSKSMQEAERLYRFLAAHHARRDDCLLALGGGVVGDLTGFAAATYMRGIDWIQVPTTLMAQVDSSIGGKVGINAPGTQGKNLIGSFHHPKLVIIDPDLLKTLPEKEVRSGLGEVVKYGFMGDPELVEALLSMEDGETIVDRHDLILRCIESKIAIVRRDEREQGERRLLNFGHTLGHVIEAAGHYNTCSHGEAVALGMELMTRYSVDRKITNRRAYGLLLEVLDKLQIRGTLERSKRDEVLHQLKLDKKNTQSGLQVVLMEDVGRCRMACIPAADMPDLLGGFS